MDYAVSGSKLAALSYYGRGVVPAGGDLPLEMGLRSSGEDGLAFALLSMRNFGEKGIASCRESAELSLSCAARCCGTDDKSMIERRIIMGLFGFDPVKEAGGWEAAMTEEEIAEMEKKGYDMSSVRGRQTEMAVQEEADKAAFADRRKAAAVPTD